METKRPSLSLQSSLRDAYTLRDSMTMDYGEQYNEADSLGGKDCDQVKPMKWTLGSLFLHMKVAHKPLSSVNMSRKRFANEPVWISVNNNVSSNSVFQSFFNLTKNWFFLLSKISLNPRFPGTIKNFMSFQILCPPSWGRWIKNFKASRFN